MIIETDWFAVWFMQRWNICVALKSLCTVMQINYQDCFIGNNEFTRFLYKRDEARLFVRYDYIWRTDVPSPASVCLDIYTVPQSWATPKSGKGKQSRKKVISSLFIWHIKKQPQLTKVNTTWKNGTQIRNSLRFSPHDNCLRKYGCFMVWLYPC